MIRKYIIPILLGGFSTIFVVGCYKNPIEIEQYKNEVYINGAYDRVYRLNFDFVEEGDKAENFITINTSGSLPISSVANVSLAYADTLVDQYNEKHLGYFERHLWYKMVEYTKLVEIEGMDQIKINPADSIRKNVPIKVSTFGLDPDQRWALPLTVVEAKPYPVNKYGRNILVHINLTNPFSGRYKMVGRDSIDGEMRGNSLSKDKYLQAVSSRDLRLYWGNSSTATDKEDSFKYRTLNTIRMTVSDQEDSEGHFPVTMTAYGSLDFIEGKGVYSPKERVFNLEYKVRTGQDVHIVKEALTFMKKE